MGASRERSAEIRVTAPDRSRLPAVLAPSVLRGQQRDALAAFNEGRSVVVHAGPGAGRTTVALAAAAGHEPVGSALVLAPRRTSASLLQDALALAGHAQVRVMTAPALAFAILRAASIAKGRGEPSLVTAPEQDALLAELISLRSHWELEIEPGARALPGFRDELRDLITRAGQLGLDPADFEQLGRTHSRPAWIDAGQIMRDYLGVLDLEAASALDAGPRLDSGALVRRAAEHIQRDGRLAADISALIVDDAQDLTAAGIALVAALAGHGTRLLLTSCPDASVETFRGARPDAAALLRDLLPAAPLELVLDEPHANAPAVRAGVDALRGRLPLAGAPSASRRRPERDAHAPEADAAQPELFAAEPDGASGAGEEHTSGIAALAAADELDEARLIATVLRDLRHRANVPYDDMAIICRSGAAVDRIADQLTRAGLPVRTPRRLGPLRQERVVADLLDIVGLALAPVGESTGGPASSTAHEPAGESASASADDLAEPDAAGIDAVLDGHRAAQLLAGPFGDADALRLRRIRRALLDAHRAHVRDDPAEPAPVSDELLARALLLTDDELEQAGLAGALTGAPGRVASPVQRLRAMIAAARAHADRGASETLWAAWDAAGLATGWQRAALDARTDATAARSRVLGRRLDALMALFATAERFTERRPDATAADLIDQIRSQAVVEDTLAPAAVIRGRVDVLTPAQLAGEHRDTVVLARLQEGAWPDLRLRSTLFGAAELPLLAGAADASEWSLEQVRAAQRENVLADELRLAVSALSRARRRVLVTAVKGGDDAPSALFGVLSAHTRANGSWLDADALRADPGPAPDARHLVAALRAELASSEPGRAQQAARLLAVLDRAGASGVDPLDWHHQEPTTRSALLDPGRALTLSPSALERAEQCPRAWLFERSGGQAAGGAPQLIGTALHALAERHPQGAPDGDTDDLLAQLHRMLRPLRLEHTWSGRRALERADESARIMDAHLRSAPAPLAVEESFDVELGPVRLRGTIDRIEGDERGLVVADLKTGRRAKSAADAEQDLQLAAYQVAVREGALTSALGADAPDRLDGARLVYVGTGTKKASIRLQGPISRAENPAWFDELVERVAGELTGTVFEARRNAHCDTCAVRTSCPLQPEGAQL